MKNYPIILDEISEYITTLCQEVVALQQQNEQLIKQQQTLVNLICVNTNNTIKPNTFIHSSEEGYTLVVTDLETGETSSFVDEVGYQKHPTLAVMEAVKFYIKWDGEN